jgi:DNA-binding transcriptional MerR regulator/effector-binding domain-containing protein
MAAPPDKAALFSIGEFSQVVGLTIKALRFYHDEGILLPALIDPQTGYRYYDPAQIQRARAVAFLRGLGFSVADIKDLLSAGASGGGDEDRALLAAMQRHKGALRDKVRNLNQIIRQLEHFISQERQAAAMAQATTYDVQEKHLEPMLIGGVRMKGKYSGCGKGFARLGRALGRYIGGKPLLLHYDREYHEDDADFEAAMPLRRQPKAAAAADGITLRQIPGGRFVCLIHKGPYDQLGHSYARILKFIKERGYTIAMPTREVYLKGPGMIFKGNPKNYLTEIQILIEGS